MLLSIFFSSCKFFLKSASCNTHAMQSNGFLNKTGVSVWLRTAQTDGVDYGMGVFDICYKIKTFVIYTFSHLFKRTDTNIYIYIFLSPLIPALTKLCPACYYPLGVSISKQEQTLQSGVEYSAGQHLSLVRANVIVIVLAKAETKTSNKPSSFSTRAWVSWSAKGNINPSRWDEEQCVCVCLTVCVRVCVCVRCILAKGGGRGGAGVGGPHRRIDNVKMKQLIVLLNFNIYVFFLLQ